MKRTIVVVLTCMALAAVGFAEDKWENITKDDDLPSNEIHLIHQDEAGNILIGTAKGLAKYKDGSINVVLEDQNIWEMTAIDDNEYWVGIDDGLVLMKNGEIEWKEEEDETPFWADHSPTPIVQFEENTYWALGSKGKSEEGVVAQGDADGWEKVPFFEEKTIVDLFRQENGTIWVARDADGVYEVDPEEDVDEARHHLQGFNVTAMEEDSDGNLWCGTWERGVHVYEDGEWNSHLKDQKTYVFNISQDSEGHIWVATSNSGVWEYDGKDWKEHLGDEQINMLETTPDGRVWISTQRKGGLRYWNGDEWEYTLDNRLPFRCVFQSRDERIWAGSVLQGVFVSE